MKGFVCPHCNTAIHLDCYTQNSFDFFFESVDSRNDERFVWLPHEQYTTTTKYMFKPSYLSLDVIFCPHCQNVTIKSSSKSVPNLNRILFPTNEPKCKDFSRYVPAHIQQDYAEAYATVEVSGKASATLSRRCLQSMIRDFWDIKNKRSLHDEIEALRGKIDQDIVDTLLAFKSICNIGAHPDKNSDINLLLDVEPHEAMDLIAMVEYLITNWYVDRYNMKQMFNSIKQTNAKKIAQKTATAPKN